MATVTARRRWLSKERFAPAQGWGAWAVHHAWIVPIVGLALWLRVVGIGDRFLYGDEAEYAIVARYLSRDWSFLAYPAIEGFGPLPFVSQPPLILYLMSFSMRILGPTDIAALVPSILLGTASVVALYALGHRLGGRWMGISAALVLAVLPFHVEMSRKAMLDAGYTFFLVLTAYFLVAWMQDRTPRAAIGVGVAVACAALSKLPGLLAGPIALIAVSYVLAITLARGTRAEKKAALVQTSLMAVPIAVGAALYLGLLWYLEALSNLWIKLQWQLGRVDSSRAQVQDAAQSTRDGLWYFTNPQFGFKAMIGATIVTLAAIGIGIAAARFARRPIEGRAHLVAPLFAVVLLGFFTYSERKEGFYLLPFAPFVALGVAYLGDAARRSARWAILRARLDKRLTPIAVGVGILLVANPVITSASASYHSFALAQTNERYFGYGNKEAALYIHEHDPDAAAYGSLLGRFSLHWYNEQPAYHWYVDHTLLEAQIAEGKLKYVVYDDYLGLAQDREYMKQLINKHNGQAVAKFRAGWGEVMLFELRPG